MTRAETTKIIMFLADNYDSINEKIKNENRANSIVNMWYSCFEDIDYKLVLRAIQKTIITSKYPPTISEIRDNCIPKSEELNIDYWKTAYKMISNSSYMTSEEFEQYPEICKRFFGSVTNLRPYGQMQTIDVNNNIQPRFLKYAESYIKYCNETKKLPEKLKNILNDLANKLSISQ